MIKATLFDLTGRYVGIRGAIVEEVISSRALVIEDPLGFGTRALLLFETPFAPPPEEGAIDVRGWVYSTVGVRSVPALASVVGDDVLRHYRRRPIIVAGTVSTLEGLPLYRPVPAVAGP